MKTIFKLAFVGFSFVLATIVYAESAKARGIQACIGDSSVCITKPDGTIVWGDYVIIE